METDEFDLNPELVEQIIFAMENQKEKFYLDSHVPSLVPYDSMGNSRGKLYELPLWEPSDGYRLMEQFVLSLRNPVFREYLSSILHGGSGVFRKFKDALNQRQDMERKWFSFKDKYMKERVFDWYNSLRLEWGLDAWEMEYNGEYSPVLTDFSIVNEKGDNLELIASMDRLAFSEIYSAYPEDYISDLFRRQRDGFEPEVSDDSRIIISESPEGEVVGFLWITTEVLEEGTTLGRIRQIYITPEFRGLGLGNKMMEKGLEDSNITSCDLMEIDIPFAADFITGKVSQMGFAKVGTFMIFRENGE